jgi:hypothetical protein
MSRLAPLGPTGQSQPNSLPPGLTVPTQHLSKPDSAGDTRTDLGICADDDDPGGIRAALTELWQELISEFRPGSSAVALGPDVDFFAAGGNSILAVMMLSRVYEEIGVDVSFPALLEASTIRALSRHIIELVLADPVPTCHTG